MFVYLPVSWSGSSALAGVKALSSLNRWLGFCDIVAKLMFWWHQLSSGAMHLDSSLKVTFLQYFYEDKRALRHVGLPRQNNRAIFTSSLRPRVQSHFPWEYPAGWNSLVVGKYRVGDMTLIRIALIESFQQALCLVDNTTCTIRVSGGEQARAYITSSER